MQPAAPAGHSAGPRIWCSMCYCRCNMLIRIQHMLTCGWVAQVVTLLLLVLVAVKPAGLASNTNAILIYTKPRNFKEIKGRFVRPRF